MIFKSSSSELPKPARVSLLHRGTNFESESSFALPFARLFPRGCSSIVGLLTLGGTTPRDRVIASNVLTIRANERGRRARARARAIRGRWIIISPGVQKMGRRAAFSTGDVNVYRSIANRNSRRWWSLSAISFWPASEADSRRASGRFHHRRKSEVNIRDRRKINGSSPSVSPLLGRDGHLRLTSLVDP